jgi:NAD(P)-dependent dehydrogenase (short-subunit alcohol dehydrogenase family)
MRQQKSGRVIIISSIVDIVTLGGIGWYSAAKHATEAMADALALELYPLGIRVVNIRLHRQYQLR